MLADYYSRTGDLQSSLAEYQGIVQRVPQDADAHRSLAFTYNRLNMKDAAETEMSTAIELQPRNMGTRLQLGDLYRQSQKFDAALQTYNTILAEAPNTPEGQQAQQSIAQIQRQLQSATQAPK
jgi:tetratricopeptide (TPR) repeat protein